MQPCVAAKKLTHAQQKPIGGTESGSMPAPALVHPPPSTQRLAQCDCESPYTTATAAHDSPRAPCLAEAAGRARWSVRPGPAARPTVQPHGTGPPVATRAAYMRTYTAHAHAHTHTHTCIHIHICIYILIHMSQLLRTGAQSARLQASAAGRKACAGCISAASQGGRQRVRLSATHSELPNPTLSALMDTLPGRWAWAARPRLLRRRLRTVMRFVIVARAPAQLACLDTSQSPNGNDPPRVRHA
jgi:hypothetical protein